MADVEISRIGPGRVGSRHQHAVVGGSSKSADSPVKIDHTSPPADHQTIAAAKKADIKITLIRPGRSRPSHQNTIVGGGGTVSDMAIIITHHTAPITDHQTVAAAIKSNPEISLIGPSRVCSRYQRAVVGGSSTESDIAILIHHTCPVTNHQAVAAAIIASEKITRIRPGGSCSRYGHNVV